MFKRNDKDPTFLNRLKQGVCKPVAHSGTKTVYYTGSEPIQTVQAKALRITANEHGVRVVFQVGTELKILWKYCSVDFRNSLHAYVYADGTPAEHIFPDVRDLEEIKDYIFTLAVSRKSNDIYHKVYVLEYEKI